jgi:hypothetical protein
VKIQSKHRYKNNYIVVTRTRLSSLGTAICEVRNVIGKG